MPSNNKELAKEIILYSDGGARGNPGPAAYGVVLYEKRARSLKEIARISNYLGIRTNNQAEYEGVIAALERAHALGATSVRCNLDSELIVRQLQMKYKVKDRELAKLFLKAWKLMQGFSSVTLHHVPREKNKVADSLVNEALDKAL